MDEPREATASDIPMLARIHVASWVETYTGLLPPSEIAARDQSVRETQWTNQIASGASRIALVPDFGFAQAGPQRDKVLLARGYPQELYAIYILRAGQGRGLGRALLRAVTAASGGPMTALVLAENTSAIEFYRTTGATLVDTRNEFVGAAPITEQAFAWDHPQDI